MQKMLIHKLGTEHYVHLSGTVMHYDHCTIERMCLVLIFHDTVNLCCISATSHLYDHIFYPHSQYLPVSISTDILEIILKWYVDTKSVKGARPLALHYKQHILCPVVVKRKKIKIYEVVLSEKQDIEMQTQVQSQLLHVREKFCSVCSRLLVFCTLINIAYAISIWN